MIKARKQVPYCIQFYDNENKHDLTRHIFFSVKLTGEKLMHIDHMTGTEVQAMPT